MIFKMEHTPAIVIYFDNITNELSCLSVNKDYKEIEGRSIFCILIYKNGMTGHTKRNLEIIIIRDFCKTINNYSIPYLSERVVEIRKLLNQKLYYEEIIYNSNFNIPTIIDRDLINVITEEDILKNRINNIDFKKEKIYGVGSKLTKSIIEARPFEKFDDIMKIDKIGPVLYEKIKNHLINSEKSI